jgi:cystathionine beta-lyase
MKTNDEFTRVVDRTKTNAEKYVLRQKLFGTEDVLPMWVADMDIATPRCVREAVAERAKHPVYGYEEMPDSAYEAQIGWMKKRHGIEMKREWMFYSPSVVATINVAIAAFTRPGDKVIVQSPVYFPFFSSISNNSREILNNPLKRDENGGYTFDLDDLRSKIDTKTKLLLLCSPHNPVGRVWKKEELEGLADLCLEHGIRVVADEIHSDLVYAPNRHIPFASLSDAVRDVTVTAIGPGKTFNVAGLSASTVVIADATMREQFKRVYDSIHFAQGTIFSHAGFEAAYSKGEAWLEGLLGHLRGNAEALKRFCDGHPEKIDMKIPEGTYLAWLDCKKMGLGDKKLRRYFVEEAKLGLSPGLSFGKEGSGFMRLNFAVPKPLMDEALSRLEAAFSE